MLDRRRAAVTIGLVAALSLAACGGTQTLDRSVLENKIKNIVEQRDETVATVACPSGVKAEQGARFSCKVSERNPDPTTYDVRATVTDSSGHFVVVVHGNTFTDRYTG